MDPLPPLTPLATNIKQFIRQLPNLECRLHYPCRLDSTEEDILVGGKVRGRGQVFD